MNIYTYICIYKYIYIHIYIRCISNGRSTRDILLCSNIYIYIKILKICIY